MTDSTSPRPGGITPGNLIDSTGRRAERITPGNALQIMDIYHPRTGEFFRQIVMRGTPEQVRAYGMREFYHPSQHEWHRLTVAANLALATREGKLAHIGECGLCVVDEEIAGYLPDDTEEDLADFIAASHYAAQPDKYTD
ncbi:hypothetical protein GT755_38155 [Herbidospora sp. NEAU-GS84]|uniref:Uncharacterized protein n=1 Tax=Herbidospora solisilvae TaxID=2696284 RepID=A0A7C9NN53_9ACTN|nr:hypothetical protein [Herbidospora solisilvae]NAS27478.1 hypothetical protein [Herbidospora solisilvae]